MRVCFLLPALARSGGASVVIRHAQWLARQPAVAVDLVLTESDDVSVDVGLSVRGLAEARGDRYDIAIATWWETTRALWELDAERHVCFLQSFEQRFYRDDELVEQLGAESVLSLPVDFIVVARWMRDLLLELRPDASCIYVPNGIDAAVFARERALRPDGSLRILIEGQPSLWFKGVSDAVRAARAMHEPAEVTLLALNPASAEGLDVDRVVGALDPPEVAELYAETDVLLKLSRVESLGLPPLEAMQSGVPSIVTPFTGVEEYLQHGVNGVVVPFDDLAAATRWLDRLARDRELLDRLALGARQTAGTWPSPGLSADAFTEALETIVASSPPLPDARLLQRTLALNGELGREQAAQLRHTEAALVSAIEAGEAHSEALTAMLAQRSAELVALKATRSYRLHRAAARIAGLVRR